MILILKSHITKLFIFVFLVIGISNIYAAAACWDKIICDQAIMTNGDILTYNPEIEITCIIADIHYRESSMGVVDIEILQPGYSGATLRQNIYVNDAFLNFNGSNIFFTMGRAMSPTYINCYDVVTNNDGELIRTNSMRHFNLSFGNTWYSTIDPHPKPNMWESTNLVDNKSGKKFAVDNSGQIDTTIKDTNMVKTYENLKSDETNWFFYGVSLFMFIIGLLLIFTTVIAYTKRR